MCDDLFYIFKIFIYTNNSLGLKYVLVFKFLKLLLVVNFDCGEAQRPLLE